MVGKCGVATHPVVVLNPALGWKTIVIPTHRVEDISAAHSLEPCNDVGVGIAEHVTDVQ